MKKIIIIWMVAGIALLIWSAVELWKIGHNSYLGINSGAFKSNLIAVGFSLLCIIGSTGLRFKKNWGRIIILLVACISLLYAVAYLLMGGFEDTGPIYAGVVAGLFLLSIATLAIATRKKKYKD